MSITRWRAALFTVFGLTGVGFAAWSTRIPQLRADVGIDLATFGVVLLALPVGSVTGTILAGRILRRWSTRRTMRIGILLIAAGLVGIGVAGLVGTPAVLAGGLGCMGLGFGLADVAISVDGAALERETGRSVLPTLHGVYSLGMLSGAGLGTVAIAAGVPTVVHLAASALVVFGAALWGVRFVPDRPAETGHPGSRVARSAFLRPLLFVLALAALATAFAEGAANGWLALASVEGHGDHPAFAALLYTSFLGSTTVVRLVSGRIVERFGRMPAALTLAVLGIVGVLVFVFGADQVWQIVGVCLWGAGVALGFPLAVSAAGETAHPTAAIAFVTSIGYGGYLVAPAILGLIAGAEGVLAAILSVVVWLTIAAFCTPAMRRRRTAGSV